MGLSANPEVTRRISEWQPTTLRDVQGMLFFASAALVVGFLGRRGRVTSWATLVWLAFFFVIGAYTVRGIAWWSLAAVAAVAPLMSAAPLVVTEREQPRVFRIVNAAVAARSSSRRSPCCRSGVRSIRVRAPRAAPSSYAPSGITSELKRIAGTDERIFNPQPWGSWFEFAAPKRPSRSTRASSCFRRACGPITRASLTGVDGWEGILDRWGVTVAVVAPADAGLRDRLVAAGWTETYVDADGSVLQPNGSGPSGSGSTASALLESPR